LLQAIPDQITDIVFTKDAFYSLSFYLRRVEEVKHRPRPTFHSQ